MRKYVTNHFLFCLLVLFSLVVFPLAIHAQHILKGQVLSSKDSLPVVAKILEVKGNVVVDSSYSDKDGCFSIQSNRNIDFLLFKHSGFKDSIIPSYILQKNGTIYLQPLTPFLQDVTIVSNNTKTKIKSDRVIYNLKNNIAATGRNLFNLLTELPNIQINNNQINLVGRGEVKVSIDGRIILLSDKEFVNYLQTIPANSIEKIEIVQNPSASMDALGNGGIINIITKRQKQDGYQLNIQSSYKQYQQYPGMDFSENFTGRHKRLDYFFNTNFSRGRSRFGFGNDVFMPQYDWLQTDTANYMRGNVSANFGMDYAIGLNSTIGGNVMLGRYFENGFDIVRSTYLDKSKKIDSTQNSYAIYNPIAYTQSYDLHYEWKPDSSKKKLFLDATYFDYNRSDKSEYEGYTLSSDNEKKDVRYQSNTAKQRIKIYSFRIDYSWPTDFAEFKIGSKLNFINTYVNALYYDKTDAGKFFNRDVSSEYKYDENAQAFYAEGSKQWNSLSLDIGLRGEFTQTNGRSLLTGIKQPNNYFQLYPVLNVEYKSNNENSYSVTFGRRINRPTFWNLNPYKSMLTTNSYYEGNPYLQPEYNTNLAFQYNYKNTLVSSVFVSYLNNGFADITIPDTAANFILRTPKNFVSSVKYGISETFVNNDLSWMNTNNSLQIYYTDSESKLDYVNGRNGWGTYFSSNNTLYFNKKKGISALVNFWYQMPETNLVNRSSHYYSLDIGTSLSVVANKLTLTGNVHDIFATSAPAYTSIVNQITERYRTLQLNRFFSVTATFNLGNNKISKKDKVDDADDSKNRL